MQLVPPTKPAADRTTRAKRARKRRSDVAMSLVQAVLVIMMLLGVAALGVAVRHVALHLQSLGWTEGQAVMLTLDQVVSESPRSRATSRLEGTFRYRVGADQYVGDRLSFSIAGAAGADDWDARVLAAVRGEGAGIAIWYDPDNPERSVAMRDIRWVEVGAGLLFGFMFSAVGGLFLRALRSRGGLPAQQPIGVSWRAVGIMWLIAPCAFVLAWLLWRDDMPIWAAIATLPLWLALNGTWQGLRAKRTRQ